MLLTEKKSDQTSTQNNVRGYRATLLRLFSVCLPVPFSITMSQNVTQNMSVYVVLLARY